MGKQVKIDENALKSIIAESVKKALNEKYLDIVDSGMEDYQGTGSKESKERVEKIRAKNGQSYSNVPGNAYIDKNTGKFKTNDSSYKHAQKSYGGENGRSKVCIPIRQLSLELRKKGEKNNSEPLIDLAARLLKVCSDWEFKYNYNKKPKNAAE